MSLGRLGMLRSCIAQAESQDVSGLGMGMLFLTVFP